jgi:hypothetical protein
LKRPESGRNRQNRDAGGESRADRIQVFVDHGILTTAPASDGSAYQEYVLTAKGRGAFPILVALRQWSEEFSNDPGGYSTLLVDRDTGCPVRKLELGAHDGRLLDQVETEVRTNPKAKRRRRVSGWARLRDTLRQLAFAAKPDAFLGFHLRHFK